MWGCSGSLPALSCPVFLLVMLLARPNNVVPISSLSIYLSNIYIYIYRRLMAQGPGPKTLAHPLIQRVVLLFLASSSSPNPTQSKATVKGILHWLSRSPFSSLLFSLSSLSFSLSLSLLSLFSISNPLLLYFFLFPVCLSVCLCVC